MKKGYSSLLCFLVIMSSCSDITQEQIAQIDSLERLYGNKLVQIRLNDSLKITDKIKNGQWVLLKRFDFPWWGYSHIDNPPSPELLKVQLSIKQNNETYFIHYSYVAEFQSVDSIAMMR